MKDSSITADCKDMQRYTLMIFLTPLKVLLVRISSLILEHWRYRCINSLLDLVQYILIIILWIKLRYSIKMGGVMKEWLILLIFYLRERVLAHIPINVYMKEDGLKENFMEREDFYGQIILNIMVIIHSERKVEKEHSSIPPEKRIKEVGLRENKKEMELFSVHRVKSLRKVLGVMEYS